MIAHSTPSTSKLLTSISQLKKYRQDWTSLSGKGHNPFSNFDYLFAWATVLREDQQLHAITNWSGNALTGIAPLVLNGRTGMYSLLGAEMFEMQDLPATPDAASDLASAISKLRKPVHFRRVAFHSPVISSLTSMTRARGLLRTTKAAGPPYIALSKSWQDPESNLNSGRRSDFRRMRRIAAQNGAITLEHVNPNPGQVESALERLIHVEASGWKGTAGTALKHDSMRTAFFQRYCATVAEESKVHFFFLKIGDKDAAAQLAVEFDDSFWLLRAGFDERFAKCSPGSLLTAETIRFAAGRSFRHYEFCGTTEPWTAVWTNEEHPACSVFYFPLHISSVTATAAFLLR